MHFLFVCVCVICMLDYAVGGKWAKAAWFNKENEKDHKEEEPFAKDFGYERTIGINAAKMPHQLVVLGVQRHDCVINISGNARFTLTLRLDLHTHTTEQVPVTKWIPQVN